MTTKDTKIIDLNLFSGSSELLRQSVGGFYNVTDVGKVYFEQSEINSDYVRPGKIQSAESGEFSIASEAILPSIKYANRLHGNPSDTDTMSDEDWKTFIIGGQFANKSYTGVLNDATYADHYNTSPLPYLPREVVNIAQDTALSLTTEYYNYYPRFQNTVSALDTELQAPNFYLLDESLFLPNTPSDSTSKYEYRDIKNYFTDSYVNSEKTETQKNIFILRPNTDLSPARKREDAGDRDATSIMDSDLKYVYSLAPFGNKLEINQGLTGRGTMRRDFRDILSENDYELNFLKSLKEIFQNESGLRPSMINFAVNIQQKESTGITTRDIESTTTIPIKIVDAPTMLLYNYRNPISEANDITLLNSSSHMSQMSCAFDTTGIYRYENTEKSLSVLNDVIDEVKEKFGDGTTGTYPIQTFLDQAGVPKYYETVAFRIEKIGGAPSGDANTQNTIQNIWILNKSAFIKYLDTQVKYDTDYTYKIYKYDIVQGYKYKLSDTVVTRQIAKTDSSDSTTYCLEFYDPYTGAPSPPRIIGDSLRGNYNSLLQEMNDFLNILETPAGALNSIPRTAVSFFEDFLDGNYRTALFPLLANRFDTSRASYSGTGGLNDVYKSLFSTLTSTGYSGIADRIMLAKEAILNLQQNLINENFQALEDVYRIYFSDFLPLTENYISGTLPRLNFLLDVLGEHKDDFLNYYNRTTSLIDFLTILGVAQGERGRHANMLDNLRLFFNKAFNIGRTIFTAYEIARFGEAASVMSSAIANILSLFNTLDDNDEKIQEHIEEILRLFSIQNRLSGDAQVSSQFQRLADFNITIEPSLKIVEIPLEEKSMRIVDHPPNDFVVTPHHLLDQSNRLAFYCKYDTFSMNAVTYPPTVTSRDEQNKTAYLTGHDFLQISEQTQESVSRSRFIEVHRTTTKPKSYAGFSGTLRKTIDLRQSNGDIPTDHLFVERVRENTKYYYAFRAVNENGVAGQMSPVFQSELVNDGGYVYGAFEQFLEDDLAVPPPKEPLLGFKKLLNVIPNIQHLQLDTSTINFGSSSISQMSKIYLGTNAQDTLWDAEKYFKIRLTSKKTGKKIDLNIGFEKKERK